MTDKSAHDGKVLGYASPVVKPAAFEWELLLAEGVKRHDVGAFAAGLAAGCDLRQTLTLANAATAISVQRPGAGGSMPTRADIIARLGMSSDGAGLPRRAGPSY